MSRLRLLARGMVVLTLCMTVAPPVIARGSAAPPIVGPDGAAAYLPANASGLILTFWVENPNGYSESYTLLCSRTGAVSSCSAPGSVNVGAYQTVPVQVTFSTGSPGSGTLQLTAIGFGSDAGSYNVTVTPPPPPPAGLEHYEYKVQDLWRCAASCFQVIQTYTTVPHFTRGQPQAITLVYHGDRANPRPIIQVDQAPPSGGTPTTYQMKVKVDGSYRTFTNGETTLNFAFSTDTLRLKAQFDASALATGVHPMDIEIAAVYGSGPVWDTVSTTLVVVNETTSPIARGWTIGGYQRLYFHGDSALITDGWGNAVYFAKSGSAFLRPAGEFSTLSSSGSNYVRAYPDSTKVTFNSSGYMTELRDRFNQVWTYVRDGSNRLTEVWDPVGSGRKHRLTYGANGLDTIVGPGSPSRTTTIMVDANQLLTKIKDPNNDSTVYGYASSNLGYRMITVRDRRGFTTDFEYNGAWRLTKVKAPSVPIYPSGSARPETSFTPWQSVGLPLSGTGTPFTAPKYDTIQALVTDPENRATKFTVDKWGQQLVVKDPLANTTTIVRNSDGLATQITHPWGGVETMTYGVSTLPFPTQVTATGQGTVNFRYAGYAQVDSIWGDTPPQRISIGTWGRVDWVRLAQHDSMKTSYTYESTGIRTGLVQSVTAPNAVVTKRFRYDGNGNDVADSVPDLVRTERFRDSYGRDTLLVTKDFRSGSGVTVVHPIRTTYDALNRVTVVTMNGKTTSYEYDGLHVKRVTDARSPANIYRFTANALGWITEEYDADTLGTTTLKATFEYDKSGLLRRWTNRRGQAITHTYDALGRLLTKSGTNTPTETWSYPTLTTVVAKGQITTDSIVYTTGMLLSRHDTYYCEASCGTNPYSGPKVQRTYGYNARGELTSVTPTGPTGIALTNRSHAWSAATGRLSTLTFGSTTTTYKFDRMGRLWKRELPGQTVTHQWSQSAQEEIVAPGGYSATVDRDMGTDAVARLYDELKNDDTGRRYHYDLFGQLDTLYFTHIVNRQELCGFEETTGYDCDPSAVVIDSTHGFAYDAVGNRTSQSGSYDPGNRVKTFGSWSLFTHDADGNLTRKAKTADTTDYRWTAEGRLDSVRLGGPWNKLYYDAFGRFVGWNQGSTKIRRLVWDGGNLLAETNGAMSTKEGEYSYVPGALDVLHAYIDGTGTEQHYAHQDATGNLIATTTSGQVLKQSLTYDAWGKNTAKTEPTGYEQRSWWKGASAFHRTSEFNLTYMRARWYDPDVGRFISEDPIGITGGINKYVFAGNDPVNGADPTGACFVIIVEWFYKDTGEVIAREVWGPYGCGGGGEGGGGGGRREQTHQLDQCPLVSLPLSGSSVVSSQFAAIRRRGTSPHIGYDFDVPTGTLVGNVVPGRVEYVGYGSASAGNFVVVRAAPGFYYRYLHLSEISVRVGQEAGYLTPIGRSGQSGTDRPHLHIDAHRNGEWVDPFTCAPQ